MPSVARRLVRLGSLSLLGALAGVLACSGGDPSGSVDPPPSGGGTGGSGSGSVHTDTFASAALGVTKQYEVYLPPSYSTQTSRRYPVIYFLHGNPGTETDWVQQLAANVVLDSLARAGLPEVIGVFADGDEWWYTDWLSTPLPCTPGYTGAAPYEPCVPGLHYRYETYIANDLVAHIDATYRTQPDMAHRGITGYSMGGYGAALIAIGHPDLFTTASIFSGARLNLLEIPGASPGTFGVATSIAQLQAGHGSEWPSWVPEYGTSFANWQANDPSSMVVASKSAGRRIPSLWIVVGTTDPLRAPNEYFHGVLTQLGVSHVYSEPPGDHSIGFWRAHEGDGIAWMLQHFGS